MENFFEDHCHDAFGSMVEAFGDDFDVIAAPTVSFVPFSHKASCHGNFLLITFVLFLFSSLKSTGDKPVRKKNSRKLNKWVVLTHLRVSVCGTGQILWQLVTVGRLFKKKKKRTRPLCLLSHRPHYIKDVQRAYSNLLSDVMHSIPPSLLASLLHEELQEQRDRSLFFEGATGGALAFVPFDQSGSRSGCLLYPGNKGQDCLSILWLVNYQGNLRVSSGIVDKSPR